MSSTTHRNRPELLAPAGTMEKLICAVRFGADAVYMGGPAFGLRNMAGNFSLEQMPEALEFCHQHHVRCFLTINSYPPNNRLPELEAYLQALAPLPFDAYIVSDPGVIRMVRRISPDREIHLSTQANTINYESALFWQEQGIARVNLAREMTLSDIQSTIKQVDIPCEVFSHGALCIAYSGRCLLSSAMTDRSANLGECTQPCRWEYTLVEKTRPDQSFPIEEDHDGTYIFNSRDLCLLEQLPALIDAGVASLKIEGRMKGVHYLASVIRIYRAAIDRYCADPSAYQPDPEWFEELDTISNRGYTTGFLFGNPRDVGQTYHAGYQRTHQLVAVIEELLPDNLALVAVRNRFSTGETVSLIGPLMRNAAFTVGSLTVCRADGNQQEQETVHPNMKVLMTVPPGSAPGDLIRRESVTAVEPQSEAQCSCCS